MVVKWTFRPVANLMHHPLVKTFDDYGGYVFLVKLFTGNPKSFVIVLEFVYSHQPSLINRYIC